MLTGEIIPKYILSLSLLIVFAIPGILAMIIMKFNFNIAPDINESSELIEKGPYRIIRHPMYTSVIGIHVIWVANDFSYFRGFILLILIIDILFKLSYEEKILIVKFSEYRTYIEKTKKIIPFIY